MKRFSLLLCSALLLFGLPAAHAAELRAGEDVGIIIPVKGDLYAVGGTVLVGQPVTGDFIAAGGDITVTGNITEDALLAGGKISVSGDIGEDVRIAGGQISIQGDIGEDLVVFGGTVRIEPDAIVRGDVLMMGGDLVILGTVRGAVRMRGGRVMMEGKVAGPVDLRADEVRIGGSVQSTSTMVAKRIKLMEGAALGDSVTYWTPDGEMNFGAALKGGEAIYLPELGEKMMQKKDFPQRRFSAEHAFRFLLSLFSAAILIGLIVWATRTFFTDTTKLLTGKKIGHSFLTGLLYFLCMPVAAVLIAITFIGFPIALMMMALYFFSLYLTLPLTAITGARLLAHRYKKVWNKWQITGFALCIFIVLKVLMMIPLFGWLVVVILVCTAYGAVLQVKWVRMKKVL